MLLLLSLAQCRVLAGDRRQITTIAAFGPFPWEVLVDYLTNDWNLSMSQSRTRDGYRTNRYKSAKGGIRHLADVFSVYTKIITWY